MPTPTAAPVDKPPFVAMGVEAVVEAVSVEDVDVEEAVVEVPEVEEEGAALLLLDCVPAVALDIINTSVAESVSRVCSSQTAMENSGETERLLFVATVQVKFVAPIWSSAGRYHQQVAVQAVPSETKHIRVMYSKGPSV